jgi:hypothetical protein
MGRMTFGVAMMALLLATSAGEALLVNSSPGAFEDLQRMPQSDRVDPVPTPVLLAGHLGPDVAEIERILQGIWSNVRATAQSGGIDRLLTYIAIDQQDKYRHVFADLVPDALAQSIGSIEMIHLMSVRDYWAEVEAIRTENGEKFSYPMSFIKERGEVWKLEGF